MLLYFLRNDFIPTPQNRFSDLKSKQYLATSNISTKINRCTNSFLGSGLGSLPGKDLLVATGLGGYVKTRHGEEGRSLRSVETALDSVSGIWTRITMMNSLGIESYSGVCAVAIGDAERTGIGWGGLRGFGRYVLVGVA